MSTSTGRMDTRSQRLAGYDIVKARIRLSMSTHASPLRHARFWNLDLYPPRFSFSFLPNSTLSIQRIADVIPAILNTGPETQDAGNFLLAVVDSISTSATLDAALRPKSGADAPMPSSSDVCTADTHIRPARRRQRCYVAMKACTSASRWSCIFTFGT